MDYRGVAQQIYEQLGGKENILSAAHCATRLRLVVADDKKCNKKALEDVEGVKGVFVASGQLQIILGTGTVNKVYDEFIKITGITGASKDEVKQMAAAKQPWFKRLIKTLGDIFVPIIPAIVASGFLMGIMEALNFMVNNGYVNINTGSSIYVFAQLFSNTAYTFLPILIAFSAGKAFGANPYLAAVIGMIMIHPNLQNAWTVATEGVLVQQEVFFGIYEIPMVGYQGHVIPVIIAVWILAFIEKRMHKVVPASLDLFATPLVSVFVTGYLTLAAVGPVFTFIENAVIDGIQWLIALPLGIGSFVMGGAYATTVVSGIHHMYTVIDIGQLSKFGFTYWLPLASAANVAQGAAALAVGLKSKNSKIKALALPSSLSAFMGITEPAIFGVNLRFMKPFVMASIGGAFGALYASIVGLGATGTGVTGIFGILLHLHSPINYIIAMLIAAGVAFALTWCFGYKDEVAEQDTTLEMNDAAGADGSTGASISANAAGTSENIVEKTAIFAEDVIVKDPEANTVYAPLKGQAMALAQVNDPTFAGEILGKGFAVEPAEGKVVAPVNGEITTVFDTKHALGITGEDGTEILIHIGLNTVELEGKYYDVKVAEGQKVKAGQVLCTFDMAAIKAAGYEITTPVIVTNTDDYSEIELLVKGEVDYGQKALRLNRA